ncbi:MAG TPA: hypothetical protein VM778_09550 [Gemmatimonadota bacterium]|nr:hypothetical protein [Gemmatimonadota bacterium]
MRPMIRPLLGTALLALACSGGGGPTAIEIPIDRLELVLSCGTIPETQTCVFRAEAFSGEQQVANPVLRWFTSNSTVATVEGAGSSATVLGRQTGQATITVSNSTGSVSDGRLLHVIRFSPK